MNCTRNEVKGRHFQAFISEILRVVGLLGEKFTFFNSLETTKISRSHRLSLYINIVLLINFAEQFELCLYFKYSRSNKFYNLDEKTFETDFNYPHSYLNDWHEALQLARRLLHSQKHLTVFHLVWYSGTKVVKIGQPICA